MSPSDAMNIGNVLLAMGVVTKETLRDAVFRQMEGASEKLGALLIERHAIPEAALIYALQIQGSMRAGDSLTAHMMIMEYQASRMSESLDRQGVLVAQAEKKHCA